MVEERITDVDVDLVPQGRMRGYGLTWAARYVRASQSRSYNLGVDQ